MRQHTPGTDAAAKLKRSELCFEVVNQTAAGIVSFLFPNGGIRATWLALCRLRARS
jgi:hypothetical protein